MMFATPVRRRAWSSTTRTRARSGGMFKCRYRERRRLPRHDHFRSRPWCGDDGEGGADAIGPLVHADQAEADTLALAGKAAAVVGHRETEADGPDGRGLHVNPPRPC